MQERLLLNCTYGSWLYSSTVMAVNISVCTIDGNYITFKEETMKKIVSAMALCVVLFGTIMMVTGCGSKPKAGTVWKTEKMTAAGVDVPVLVDTYFCFHSDGNLYFATKVATALNVVKMGTYTIGKKDITIKNGSVKATWSYTLKGEKMTLEAEVNGVKTSYSLQKVSSPTEEDIAKAAK